MAAKAAATARALAAIEDLRAVADDPWIPPPPERTDMGATQRIKEQAEEFKVMAEKIRHYDAKSEEELVKLAAEVEGSMQDIGSVEPQIRDMLERRQRVMAAKENPVPPRTPEAVTREQVETGPVYRQCCCGCGAMLICGSVDAGMTELCRRQHSEFTSAPPVNASAQRAHCEKLSKKKIPTPKNKPQEPIAPEPPARRPNYNRLQEMAVPREEPVIPPQDTVFRANPVPTFIRRPPKRMVPSFSAPDLPSLGRESDGEYNMRGDHSLSSFTVMQPPLRSKNSEPFCREPASWSSPPAQSDGSSASHMVDLRCHALKSKARINLGLLPTQNTPKGGHGGALLPGLGQDFATDDVLFDMPKPQQKRVTASTQKKYVDARLYHSKTAGPPGGVKDLQARLDALRLENQPSKDEEALIPKPRTKYSNVCSKFARCRDSVPVSVPEIAAEIS